MRDTAQAALNTAQDNRHIRISFAAALTIDDSRTVRALVGDITGRVRIIATNLAISGIAVNHAVHVARRHAIRIDRFAQFHKGVFALPIWLSNDTDAKAL